MLKHRRSRTLQIDDRNVRMAVVFDIDGVLCDNSAQVRQRAHEILSEEGDVTDPANWAEHNKQIGTWPAHEGWAQLARVLHRGGYTVVMLTNRPEELRHETGLWLHRRGIPCDRLVMFQDGQDYYGSKEVALGDLLREFHVLLAVDDSTGHCQMYEQAGVPNIHVNNAR